MLKPDTMSGRLYDLARLEERYGARFNDVEAREYIDGPMTYEEAVRVMVLRRTDLLTPRDHGEQ